jgi:AraC family transcriptional regulator
MKRSRLKAVGKMQDYIESRLTETITLHDLAKASGLSPWHASRVFKEVLGKTPFEYIRACRVSGAALKLRDGRVRVIDVAFDFVFDTPEGFTRAFSRRFGINPAAYKREKPPIGLFIPHRVMENHPDLFKEGPSRGPESEDKKEDAFMQTVFVQVIERPARKMILKRGGAAAEYYAYCREVGCDVWGMLVSVKEALYEPVGVWLPKRLVPEGTSVYCQGVEVPAGYAGRVPKGYDLIDLEPCKMMVFQGPPFKDEEFENAIKSLWDVMKSYNPEIYGFEWADDDGPRFQMAPEGYRGYIEGRPVRETARK